MPVEAEGGAQRPVDHGRQAVSAPLRLVKKRPPNNLGHITHQTRSHRMSLRSGHRSRPTRTFSKPSATTRTCWRMEGSSGWAKMVRMVAATTRRDVWSRWPAGCA